MRVTRFQSPNADPQRPGGHGLRRPSASQLAATLTTISEFAPSSMPDLMAEPDRGTTRLTVVDLLDALCASASGAEVADVFNALAAVYELPWGPAQAVELDRSSPLPTQGIVVEVPEEYEVRMVRRGKVQHLHTVMPHVTRTSLTVTWDAAAYQLAGKGEFYEAMSDFESGQSLRLALRLPGQRRFIVTFDTDAALLKEASQRLPLIAQVQLFAIHLNEAAWAVCHARHQVSPLTPRETDVLLGTLAGRTVYEVGQQLKLSEAMVAKHGNSAAMSLGCVGRHQATARALHMGWLGV
jgi:DNA-binding CsgD family transcriptional regulator